ncbi:hypothetical protein X754_03000 [Mesorhizobium sp. LNJC403B00]|nr:hypothetical protein X754_03000 [Mesorhizobium sp. LNJC403B00]
MPLQPIGIYDGIEAIQIFQERHVTHDRRNAFHDEGCGLVQLFLSSPGNHDARSFFYEALGCGQSDPAASARDDCDLAFEFFHNSLSFVAHGPGTDRAGGQS